MPQPGRFHQVFVLGVGQGSGEFTEPAAIGSVELRQVFHVLFEIPPLLTGQRLLRLAME